METLGLLPHPWGSVCPDWGLPVYFCRDREQLLLHTLAVAHPGGHLCGVPASTQGEETGVVGLEPGLELELELETTDLWLHAVREWHRWTLHCHAKRTEVLQWSKVMSHWFQKVRRWEKNVFLKSKKGLSFYGSHLWVVLKQFYTSWRTQTPFVVVVVSFLNTNQTCWNLHGGPLIAPAQVWAPKTSGSTPADLWPHDQKSVDIVWFHIWLVYINVGNTNRNLHFVMTCSTFIFYMNTPHFCVDLQIFSMCALLFPVLLFLNNTARSGDAKPTFWSSVALHQWEEISWSSKCSPRNQKHGIYQEHLSTGTNFNPVNCTKLLVCLPIIKV